MNSTSIVIQRQVKDVIFKIVLFVFVYVLLIALGATLIWFAFKLAFWMLGAILDIRNIRAIIFILLAVAGGVGFALMFGLYLVKFLFSKTRNENSKRRLVTEQECPELFKAIREVAGSTNCPMPKKVFLSPDVNACVFYDTSFWSIFFPVKKNLEIGLGLFTCTNMDELKSILAHEFGHFSQDSMKVGSGVYVANTVLCNLAYGEDRWDKWVHNWSRMDLGVFSLFGTLTQWITNQVRKLLHVMYRFVNRSYMKLSRSMEYDADAIACRYIGKDVFSSALRKIDYLSYTYQVSQRMLANLSEEGKKTDNIFEVHEVMTGMLAKADKVRLECAALVTANVDYGYPESRVKTENIWDTHPPMDDRIASASGKVEKETDYRPAWVLIPEKLVREISDTESVGAQEADAKPAELITRTEMLEKCREYYEQNTIPRPYSAFLRRKILVLPNRDEVEDEGIANPFTFENTALIKEYEVALADWNTLNAIREKQMEVEKVYYQGKEYPSNKLPLDEHRAYYESLKSKAKKIDIAIYQYLIRHAKTEAEASEIRFLYDAIRFSNVSKAEFEEDIYNRINVLVYHFNRGVGFTEEELNALKTAVFELKDIACDMMNKDNWEMIAFATDPGSGVLKQLQDFAADKYKPAADTDVSVDYINSIFNNANDYINQLSALDWKAKSRLAGILMEMEAA